MPDSPTSAPESAFVCDCEDWLRSACAGEPFYKEHEGKRYCVLHLPGKKKSADFQQALQRKLENQDFDFRGVWFPDKSFERFEFRTKADFNSANFSETVSFSFATFSAEADFDGVTFSAETDFSYVTFSARANFYNATFSAAAEFEAATFRAEANCSYATFNAEANFLYATFGAEAYFQDATFRSADFNRTTFSGEVDFRFATFNELVDFTSATFGAAAIFSRATFGDANFAFAIFSAVAYFNEAIFTNYVEFAGNQDRQSFSTSSSLDLQFATIEKPDRVSFHTLTMHPHWFVNIDPRKFDFTNVEWKNSGKAKPEVELLKSKIANPDKTQESPAGPTDSEKARKAQIKKLHHLLSQACQRLAANREENSDYREASHCRRMALDAERLKTWRGFDFRRLNWWYWLASGYGERPFQALVVLLAMLLVFAALYTQVGFARWEPKLATEADVVAAKKDDVGAPLQFSRALTYSAAVLTFQRPEPKPATTTAQAIVLLETILGPVQAALLALAIRRKFMR